MINSSAYLLMNCFKKIKKLNTNVETSERLARAHMGTPERLDTMPNWTELKKNIIWNKNDC